MSEILAFLIPAVIVLAIIMWPIKKLFGKKTSNTNRMKKNIKI